jgi:hypothetical protein
LLSVSGDFRDTPAGATNPVGLQTLQGERRRRPKKKMAGGIRSRRPVASNAKLSLRLVLVFPARAIAVGRLDAAATGSALLIALTVRLVVALLRLVRAVALVVGHVVSSLVVG